MDNVTDINPDGRNVISRRIVEVSASVGADGRDVLGNDGR